MTANSSNQLQRLLDEAPFVRALAGALAATDADDVAQTAWLRAIVHDAPVAKPRQWLAQILRRVTHNLHRTNRRRALHEQAAARSDVVPSSAELMEREERRRELVQAVDALPEPLRAVLVLRYFEELPPRIIAARLGLPAPTVWNRLRTALQTLRQQLDLRHGDRRAFLLPLLPATGTVVSTSMLAMAKGKVLAGVVLAAAALLTLWATDLLPTAPPVGPTPAAPVSPLVADLGPDKPTETPIQPERTEVAAPSPTPAAAPITGALVVAATYVQDGTPVQGLVVMAAPSGGESRFLRRRAQTDGNGVARIEELAPGEWQVLTSRNDRARATATVIAGEEQRVGLVLPIGIHITGIVVDANGLPVGGVEIHLAPSAGQRADLRPVTLSGADGRFDLRSCSGRAAVGARAAGHAPSRMHYVNLQDGGDIDLRLELPGPGGVVEGTVFAPDRTPIADAAVVIGEGLADIVLTTNEGAPAPPAYVYTDANGHFRAVGITPGEHPVEAHAAGFGRWTGTFRVETHTVHTMDVVLQRGFACNGVVLDAKGAPVVDADVNSGSRNRLGFLATRSRPDGTFRLEGLPAGDVEVRAAHGNVRATTTVRGGPGESVSCELRLDAALELRGRVLTTTDTPVADAYVVVQSETERSAGRLPATARTDAEGRFVLRGCPDDRRLTVQAGGTGYRTTARLDVDPRAGEVVLRLTPAPPPSVRIRGRITSSDGQAVAQAQVQADESNGQGTGLEPTTDAGTFALGPLVPGRWRICVQVPGAPWRWTEWRDLAADAEWDLGELRAPEPGTIAVRTRAPEGLSFHVVVFDAELRLGNWGALDEAPGLLRSKPLAPGLHHVMAHGEGVDGRMLPVEVRSGAETVVELTVQPGLRRRFEVRCGEPLSELHVRIEQGGRLVNGWSSVGRSPGTIRMTERRSLAPGDYVVTARGDGRSGEARFTVRDGGEELVRIELR